MHGCARELRALLSQLPISDSSTVVFLGDYVDRGPDSKGVIDLILELSDRCRVIALKGNHEALMLDFLTEPHSVGAALFVLNGGVATLASYADGEGGYLIPSRHREFLEGLRLCWESERHFFVHAGVPNRPLAEIDLDRDADTLLWVRSAFLNSSRKWEKTIVHGHSPVDSPEVLDHRINLDTGCVFGNRLTALDLTDLRFYSVPREASSDPQQGLELAKDGTRVAPRFGGVAPVFVELNGKTLEFETLNYNQFGLLLQERERGRASLEVGQRISGWLGSLPDSRVDFDGVVARSERRGETALYGVRFEAVRSKVDELDYGAGRGAGARVRHRLIKSD